MKFSAGVRRSSLCTCNLALPFERSARSASSLLAVESLSQRAELSYDHLTIFTIVDTKS